MFNYLIVCKTHLFSYFLFNMPLGLTSVYLAVQFHYLVNKKNGAMTFNKGFMGEKPQIHHISREKKAEIAIFKL